ncbi:MAG: hypothetical protein ACJ0BE_06645 [Dehalococcoidia bacterium]
MYLDDHKFDSLVIYTARIILKREFLKFKDPKDFSPAETEIANEYPDSGWSLEFHVATLLMFELEERHFGEDRKVLEKQIVNVALRLVDFLHTDTESSELPNKYLDDACHYYIDVYRKDYDRYGNKLSFMQRKFSRNKKNTEYDSNREENSFTGIVLGFRKDGIMRFTSMMYMTDKANGIIWE